MLKRHVPGIQSEEAGLEQGGLQTAGKTANPLFRDTVLDNCVTSVRGQLSISR